MQPKVSGVKICLIQMLTCYLYAVAKFVFMWYHKLWLQLRFNFDWNVTLICS